MLQFAIKQNTLTAVDVKSKCSITATLWKIHLWNGILPSHRKGSAHWFARQIPEYHFTDTIALIASVTNFEQCKEVAKTDTRCTTPTSHEVGRRIRLRYPLN